jgi:hypothetical protein
MLVKPLQVACASLLLITALSVDAIGTEDSNNCRGTTGDYCERSGSCSIQGSDWYQYVTIDKSDKFDTQGGPVCAAWYMSALSKGIVLRQVRNLM